MSMMSDMEEDSYGRQMSQVKRVLLDESRQKKELRRKDKKKNKEKEHVGHIMEAMEAERAAMMAQWKEELARERHEQSLTFQCRQMVSEMVSRKRHQLQNMIMTAEAFISNLPLTIGAIALAWVTMGVDWWKFTEEMLDTCTPAAFRSPQCTFAEFPGCFDCTLAIESSTTNSTAYHVALHFHYLCHTFAAVLLLGFVLKAILAWEIVWDELSNPTTSTPCGLVLITTCVIGAGRGIVGEMFVLGASLMHVLLFCWFVSMAMKHKMLPDPSWAPNTVGICYAAVKTWLYLPVPGLILMGVSEVSFSVCSVCSVAHCTPVPLTVQLRCQRCLLR
jgi:hypothetical protein